MAFVSVAEAASLVKRDRKVLYRDYIGTGKLSASKDARGRMQIEISELLRVFGSFSSVSAETQKSAAMPQIETGKETVFELEKLRQENAFLREKLDAQAANLNDLRNAMKLLEHKKDPEKRRRWWPF
jgi:hypothetical protein